jgi:3'-phosphoadenosine 5'-phosphosulfate sulfotransferase (PAPS reductase)/FAD synthetase
MIHPQRLIAEQLAGVIAPCITSSFQADGVVLLHMFRALRPGIPVLFLDTLHHFAQTCEYRDMLAERWGLNLVNLRAAAAPGSGGRARTNAVRATRWSRFSRPWQTTTSGSRRCGVTNRRAARDSRRSSTWNCPPARSCER